MYVLGVDLGTSAVKVLLVDRTGAVKAEATSVYPLIQEKSGYSEQDPAEWVSGTSNAIREALQKAGAAGQDVEGISFSGQMHGLVLLDEAGKPLRNAILWNDTRTTKQCREIEQVLGADLLGIAKNPALEGFTLPKLLWVKEHEPELFAKAKQFVLPKDYVRYRICGEYHMDVSDAAGTLLLDVKRKQWSERIADAFGIPLSMCPPIVEAHACVGEVQAEFAQASGLAAGTKVFAGGADNACGAIGAGILKPGMAMCSIGTSGVVLTYAETCDQDFGGKVHLFNHGKEQAYYAMGVTLAAGYSMSWFKDTFAPEASYEELLAGVEDIPPGAGGLLFTPYLVGERTPHADAVIRGSFIGLDGSHKRSHIGRAVMEGITFSLHESVEMFREAGVEMNEIVSIGGGAKNPTWLQMQADIFGLPVVRLANEQGPGMGAAMLAAYGCGWFPSLEACGEQFVQRAETIQPNPARTEEYRNIFAIYQQVYSQTKGLNDQLAAFRA
ncbi:xylulokinase [Xylanibacillus composti]|uniref:Xylulose kinase n=1 Tax=Xylanibacillus composti TaxID=1572762 RepID=A0A8J4M0S7_9BACL|nr:xylulokinase [Xylanibacillus composti]MDT9726249.1 xylulokinase [Xylanibacillus composti]GIQ68100.1 xylulose kinase [Xylanibacillus composti]